MKKLALLLTVATVFAITSCNEKPAEETMEAATEVVAEATDSAAAAATTVVDSAAAAATTAAAGAVEAVKEEVKK